MSAQSIGRCVGDIDLRGRVAASISKETWANPTFGDTQWGQRVKSSGPSCMLEYYMWPIAIDNELAYAYALDQNVPSPGGDRSVISEENLSAGIQAHWPADPPPPAAP